MTREQIKKAAKAYQSKLPYCDDRKVRGEFVGNYTGFIAGAEWRINSVWHYALDKVQTRKKVLVLFTHNRIRIYDDIRDIKGLEDLFVCFAYVDDLLPEIKEEVK